MENACVLSNIPKDFRPCRVFSSDFHTSKLVIRVQKLSESTIVLFQRVEKSDAIENAEIRMDFG